MTLKRLSALFVAVAVAACGGGGPDAGTSFSPSPSPTPSPSPSPSPASPPGGLYVGYYQESATDNPEDPTAGAFTLSLPSGDGAFSGSMFFTFLGCQSSNLGSVAGNKSGTGISGTWAGTIDGSLQSGNYNGTYASATTSYSGTYINSKGKVPISVPNCIDYFIASAGTFEMFPVGGGTPASFTVSVANRRFDWPSTAGAAQVLFYVLDPVIAQSSGNPIVTQERIAPATSTFTLPAGVSLVSAKEYVVAVGVTNASGQRLAFASRRFTAP